MCVKFAYLRFMFYLCCMEVRNINHKTNFSLRFKVEDFGSLNISLPGCDECKEVQDDVIFTDLGLMKLIYTLGRVKKIDSQHKLYNFYRNVVRNSRAEKIVVGVSDHRLVELADHFGLKVEPYIELSEKSTI